jgi:hypothetical protein
MEYMNEGELILAYTYDDVYSQLRYYIVNDNIPKFIETFDYLLSLDPNVFQNYPIFNRLLIIIYELEDYIEIIKLLLDNGSDVNQFYTYINYKNHLDENITFFNKIILKMCSDLNYMFEDHNTDILDYADDEIKYFTKILKLFFNHPPILTNKGSPNLYEILDRFPQIKFIMIQILDDASFDVESFKSSRRLAFAKSGLAPSIIDSILHHADYDTILHTGQNINPNKYELKDTSFNRYNPSETLDEYLLKKGGKRIKKKYTKKNLKIL